MHMTTWSSLLASICFLTYVLNSDFSYLSLAKHCALWKWRVQYGFICLPVSHHLKLLQASLHLENAVLKALIKSQKPKCSEKHSPHTDQLCVVFTSEMTSFSVPQMMLSIPL